MKPHPHHCYSRCVRQSWLCGVDANTGASYEHRRQWLEDKITTTAKAFAIDTCSYAFMSNHYHLVLHVNKPQAQLWSMDEVIKRWHQLYTGLGSVFAPAKPTYHTPCI